MTTAADSTAARTGDLTSPTPARLEIMLERTSIFDRVPVGVIVAVPQLGGSAGLRLVPRLARLPNILVLECDVLLAGAS